MALSSSARTLQHNVGSPPFEEQPDGAVEGKIVY